MALEHAPVVANFSEAQNALRSEYAAQLQAVVDGVAQLEARMALADGDEIRLAHLQIAPAAASGAASATAPAPSTAQRAAPSGWQGNRYNVLP